MTRAQWLAWCLWLLSVALFATGITLQETVGATADQDSSLTKVGWALAFVGFATVGAVVASRQARNAVGWIFCAMALLLGVTILGTEWAAYTLVESPGAQPGGMLAAWVSSWSWFPLGALVAFLVLLFPDGLVPSPRWRRVLRGMVGLAAAATVLAALRPGPLNGGGDHPWPDNPLGLGALDRLAEPLVTVVFFVLYAVGLAAAVVRFRRSRGDERSQLKWMTYSLVVLALAALNPPPLSNAVGEVTFPVALALLPVAVAVAMLKYRLYDVDVVIRKTLVYGALTAVLAAVYFGAVVGMQAALAPVTEGSDLAIAVSTLLVAALFLPLRGALQGQVDRRFYRRRYDAQRTLDAFGARVREHVELEGLRADLERAVTETMQPERISLWLRAEARS